MADGSRVAVVIVSFNAGEHLPRALESLARQEAPPARTIVVDNGSSDGSVAGLETRFPSVELIALGRNTGFAAANNVGVNAAEDCDWVALLNPDAFPEPSWLRALLAAAESGGGHAFFASCMLSAQDPDLIDGIGDAYHPSGLSWRREHGRRVSGRRTPSVAAETFSASAGAALYRRDAFLSAGGFDEQFFCYLEDTDLAFRLRLRGHRCRYVPEARVLHVGSAIAGRQSDFVVYHSNRNLVWTWAKNMPPALLWPYLPLHLLVNVAMVASYALRGQAGVVLRAKLDALRRLPELRRLRAEVQGSRTAGAGELRAAMTRGLAGYQGTPARAPLDRLLGRLGLLDRRSASSA
ncbi:MAG TPA: glycosyltransferase family 2 protein [Thermoleophilaceae bacterium]|nr:glycosyltransferase family 2 protein [Thermoleophilaceae bacterium]